MTKRDIITIGIGVAVVTVLLAAPPETTPHLPGDSTHARFRAIAHEQGKKAAEKFCKNCHGKAGMEFSKDHPDPNRCLFCHKLTPQ